MSMDEIIEMMDRLKAKDLDQVQAQPVDPAQLHAYLLARGQALAQDMDLGQVQDDDLVQLGRLDAIARYHYALPAMAPFLAMISDQQREQLRQHMARAGGCTGCFIGSRHWPCTRTAPEAGTTDTPDIPDNGIGNAIDRGQVDHATRAVPETANRNGKIDQIRDRPGEEWTS
jgi:hypothetical protein